MTSSLVSSMLLFLLLLVVFPRIESALGAQMELHKLGADETKQSRYPYGRRLGPPCTPYTRCKRSSPAPPCAYYARCKRSFPAPGSPPPITSFSKDTYGPGH